MFRVRYLFRENTANSQVFNNDDIDEGKPISKSLLFSEKTKQEIADSSGISEALLDNAFDTFNPEEDFILFDDLTKIVLKSITINQ